MLWELFRKHHYLNTSHSKAARIFVAALDGRAVGFCSVLHFPHPTKRKHKRIHRIVVLPDFQGIGIGKHLLNSVAEHYRHSGFTTSIVTSAHNLVMSLHNSPSWVCIRKGRTAARVGKTSTIKGLGRTSSGQKRLTVSFEYKFD